MLVEIPIASTATKQNAESLNSFIKFLCQLNIIKILLLQVFDWNAFKAIQALDKLFARSQVNE